MITRRQGSAAVLLALVGGVLGGCAAGSSSGAPSSDGPGPGGRPGSGGSVSAGSGGASGTGGVSGSGGQLAVDARSDTSMDSGQPAPPDASGGDAAGDAPPPQCAINVIPLSSASLKGVESGSQPFRVRAEVNLPRTGDKWVWRVMTPGHDIITPAPYAADPAAVTFAVMVAGEYNITVLLGNRPECKPFIGTLSVVDPPSAVFIVRVIPNDSLAFPPQEFTRTREQLPDGLALTTQVSTVEVDPHTEVNTPLPSYLQISSAGSRLTVEGNTARGPVHVALAADRQYDLLMIPTGDRIAPRLVSGGPGILAADQAFDPGITINGQTRRADDSPVVDARVVLRSGARPSTIGRSKAQGAFTLLTREGPAAIDVAAPPQSGLPDLHVNAAAGIAVDKGSPALTLTVRWTATMGTLKVTVRAADGTATVADATVRAELTRPIAAAGQLTTHLDGAPAGSDQVLPATGTMHAEALSDPAGVATFAALPRGPYQLTVIPPAGGTSAITAATVDLNADSLAREVRLGRQVTLTGTLQPAAMTKGVRITAIDSGTDIVTPTVSALVGDSGRYQLTLHPGRQYKLWAVPAAGQPFARAVVTTITPAVAQTAFADFTLPHGMAIASRVFNTRVVANALVQIFCPESSSTCADPTLPIAEAISDLNGAFQVLLPDPAATTGAR